ncbi:uncharacterized protein EI90DRAFT_2975252 [Cantharellus anzutake]|uniref:uncharacterized protein n=1 Tax=Cantharellus anzutake TaxID=1750568 RepID=UPI0019086B36|nr:uncharacterized protein EI90DRAFT_2975252 [Cantharellus anzutake]KAF8327235.1 hypothetical protein EI90DRAFT_2975252 [Cantharellus anzutake]
MSIMLNLNCWVLGDDVGRVFRVEISNAEDVHDLKEAIMEKKPALDHVGAAFLRLWKNAELEDEKKLFPLQRLSDIFSPPPLSKHLHIIAQPPLITPGKRPRPSDDVDLALESRLAKTAPSLIGKQVEYMLLQRESNQRILDDRPTPDSVPPISLLYHGFGRFQDIFNHYPDRLDMERQNLELAVDSFAQNMTQFYHHETKRMGKGLFALNEILSLRDHPGLDFGDSCTSGHYDGPHGAASCIVEFRNELCDIALMPTVTLASCIAHSHKDAMNRPSGPALFKGWRVPCLGLTVIGPYITFYAIIFLGQWHIVSLTPTLSCIPSACEGRDQKALYAAFSAALDLLSCIDSDAKRLMHTRPKLEHGYYKLPYVSELPRYEKSGKIRFRILGLHPHVHDIRHLYIAETTTFGKEQIIVKFARRYSIALHALCAKEGHAPEILGYEPLPGGWFAIAMDYITPTVHPGDSDNLADHCQKWVNELRKLMQSFHSAGFVHGDLREPNILCSGDRVMLIDFDWGGKVGEVYYPSAQLCPELMDEREGTDPRILQADDVRVLGNTLRTIEEKARRTSRHSHS